MKKFIVFFKGIYQFIIDVFFDMKHFDEAEQTNNETTDEVTENYQIEKFSVKLERTGQYSNDNKSLYNIYCSFESVDGKRLWYCIKYFHDITLEEAISYGNKFDVYNYVRPISLPFEEANNMVKEKFSTYGDTEEYMKGVNRVVKDFKDSFKKQSGIKDHGQTIIVI